MRVKYATALSLLILACACGGDDNPQSPDDDDTEDDGDDRSSSSRDAGTKDASTKDAGKASDAGSSDAGKATDAGSTDAGKVTDAGSTDAGKVTDAGKADAGGSACDTLTYDSFGKAFLTSYCTSCHVGAAAAKGVRLDSLAGVTAAKSKVKSEVSRSAMPPLGSKAPTSAERTQFGQRIDCGPK